MSVTKSVILSCAGIGSRLGLATTKALIDINGRSLISWQLEMLKDVDDIKIIIGFQANDVINEVLKYRKDVTFVYNHNYFETKTGASFYIGAKYANELVMEIDGDLLVHPDDMRMLLSVEEEFVAFGDIMSDDAVYVRVNDKQEVLAFSREFGDFEWTGPACIQKNKLLYTAENVFNQLEPHLPMRGIKVRACDIDTYDDYRRAIDFIKSWKY